MTNALILAWLEHFALYKTDAFAIFYLNKVLFDEIFDNQCNFEQPHSSLHSKFYLIFTINNLLQ